VQKIAERIALKRFQLGIDRGFVSVYGFTGVSDSDVNSSITEATRVRQQRDSESAGLVILVE
jgi:hypothetical protein